MTAPLGAGGMGGVYRARDTRLQREVAVKVLPREFSENEQLRIRFEREAKTISALSHPNICTLYDVGRAEGHDYLVMELLEGETLADRLSRGALPLADVIRYGAQIAEALDRAHRSGVVHRDLKPGNVMITKAGAKLLDFGLAKPQASGLGPRASDSLTEHKPLTSEGMIVGTFQYMAPEQIEGLDADARSDIFALGAVLYEMATGRRAFNGSTRTSLIAAIVSSQPTPVSNLQPLTPASLDHVIERCLAKDPDERWQSAKDVAQELRWVGSATAPATTQRRSHAWIPWTIAALAVLASLALFLMRPRSLAERVVSSIEAPKGTTYDYDTSAVVLSPDGKKLAFVASGSDGKQFLWVRDLGSGAAQMLASTEGAAMPFWSPDGKWIAFFADAKLKKVDAATGTSERLTDAIAGRGGAWGSTGDIIFTPSTGAPIFRVNADNGGEAQAITDLKMTEFGISHRFPSFLPDGEHFLFFIQGTGNDSTTVFLGSTKGGQPKPLLNSDSAAIYAPPGFVLYTHDRTLRARALDLKTLAFAGPPLNVADNVLTNANLGFANVSAAGNGDLTYVTGGTTTSRIVWLDRSGKEVDSIAGPANNYFDLRLSPDGKKLAVAVDVGGHLNLFIYDVTRRVMSRATFDNVNNWGPVWSPDGQAIVYTSFIGSGGDLWVKRVTGSEPARVLFHDRQRKIVSDWSGDGKTIFYHSINPSTSMDMYAYSTATKTTRPILQTQFAESQSHLSPNGKWIAYVSNESGSNEIYVKPFDGEGKWQVSTGGAVTPVWSHDGRELFFSTRDGKLMSAAVHDATTFAVDDPKMLFPVRMRAYAGNTRSQYDVTPDGKAFVVNMLTPSAEGSAPVTLVQNWTRKP